MSMIALIGNKMHSCTFFLKNKLHEKYILPPCQFAPPIVVALPVTVEPDALTGLTKPAVEFVIDLKG